MHKRGYFDDILVHFLKIYKMSYFGDLMFCIAKNTPYGVF